MTEIFDFIKISSASYLVIGILLATVGPAEKFISNEIKKVSNPRLYEANQKPPSENKILLLRLILTLVITLLWSMLIWDILKKRRLQVKIERDHIEKSAGLWFERMGGCGSIHCQDCHHNENVTSFIHGVNSSSSGFQCQTCGKITSLTGGGRGNASQYKESLICDCSGKFDRDKAIFCPQCKSRNLLYDRKLIT